MKKLALVFILALSVIALSACGGKTKTLQMTWWSDGSEGDVMQTLLDDYETETGVVIELVNIPYDDYETRLATMISGGEAPALSRVTEGHLNNFQDSILPLDDVYTTSGFTNLFYNTDGDVISLPMDVTANGMFVNTTLLDLHSVDYPSVDDVWTWTEFELEMSKLDGLTGVAAPGLMDNKAHRMMPLFYQAGVKIWDTAYTSTNLKSVEAQAVVQMVMDFYDDGFFAPEPYAVSTNAADLFKTGEYGFHISGNWNVSGYQSITAFDWAVVPMPSGADGNRATILGGKSLAAFANSGMEQEAKDFIAWMSEGTQHDTFTGTVPYLTPRLGATVDYGDFADEYAVFLDEIANTDEMYVQDWLLQVMVSPTMYSIINDFAADCADPTETRTALQLLTQLETDLIDSIPAE